MVSLSLRFAMEFTFDLSGMLFDCCLHTRHVRRRQKEIDKYVLEKDEVREQQTSWQRRTRDCTGNMHE